MNFALPLQNPRKSTGGLKGAGALNRDTTVHVLIWGHAEYFAYISFSFGYSVKTLCILLILKIKLLVYLVVILLIWLFNINTLNVVKFPVSWYRHSKLAYFAYIFLIWLFSRKTLNFVDFPN
jgi:uncharacterized membrane protein